MGGYVKPGIVATNSLVPFGAQGLNDASYAYGAVEKLAAGIVSQSRQYGGDNSKIGMPASWPYGPIGEADVYADGSISSLLATKLQQYVNSPAARNDADFMRWLGVEPGQIQPGGYQSTPLSIAEQLAVRDQQLQEADFWLSRQSSSGGSSRTSGGTTTVRSSGGGSSGASAAADYSARLGYESASNDLDYQLALKKFELEKELRLLQFQLDNDPNNPQLQLERQRLDEQVRQFNEQLAYTKSRDAEAMALDRAKIATDYFADPGDTVAAEYFLRMNGQEPTGTPVNIFTGQASGGPTTFSQMMQDQAHLAQPYQQAAQAGTPAPQTPQDATTTPYEEVPAMAFGSMARRGADPQITKDGWTRAPEFITGDPQIPGEPNPEHIKLRVRNGEAEAKVTPFSSMVGRSHGAAFSGMPEQAKGVPFSQMMSRLPMFATGTYNAYRTANLVGQSSSVQQPSYLQGTDWWSMSQAAEQPDYSTIDSSATSFQSPIYDVDYWNNLIANSNQPTNSTGGYTIDTGGRTGVSTDSSYSQAEIDAIQAKRTQQAAQTAATAAGNPYLSDLYSGVDPNTATVQNRASPYYGMTMAEAAYNQSIANQSPVSGTVYVGNTGTTGMTGPVLPGQYSINPDRTINYTGDTFEQTFDHVISPEQHAAGILDPVKNNAAFGLPSDVIDRYLNAVGVKQYAPSTETNTAVGGGVTSGQPYQTGQAPADHPLYGETGGPTGGKTKSGSQGTSSVGIDGQPTGETIPPVTATGPVGQATFGSGPSGIPNSQTVLTAGTVEVPGGSFDLLPGDVAMPGGGYMRWNEAALRYLPVEPSNLTPITSMAQFFALPQDQQQAILTGQPTGYALINDGTDWISYINTRGMTKPPSRMLSQEEFMALPDAEKRALLDGTSTNSEFQYAPVPSWTGESETQFRDVGPGGGFATGLFTAPRTEYYEGDPLIYDYSQYMQPADWQRLYPEMFQPVSPTPIQPTPITPTPVTGTEGTGTQTGQGTGGTGTGTGTGQGTGQQGTGTAGTGGTGTTGTGTGTTGTGTGGTGTGTGGTTGTGQPTLQDILNAISAMSYGSDVYENLPALQYLQGNIGEGQYDTISNMPINVPGLGVELPGANQVANYQKLLHLQQSNPQAFAALDSLFRAGNIPLETIMAFAAANAPRGSAYEPTLIET